MTIYLDHAASTLSIANPSSIHQLGKNARQQIDQARYICSEILQVAPDEIIFTSGATESLNLSIIGTYLKQQQENNNKESIIWVSPLSHSAIWGAIKWLQINFGNYKKIIIKTLPIDSQGYFSNSIWDSDLLENSNLVIAEHGNSEIGILQPIAKIGRKIAKLRTEKKLTPTFIIDCSASIVTEQISLTYQKADLISLTGEKIGGPAGIGLCLKNKNQQIEPLFYGTQEWGLRAGTENITGIIALSEALKKHNIEQSKLIKHLQELQNFSQNYFAINFPEIKVTTPQVVNLPHIFHFIYPEIYRKKETVTADLFTVLCDQKKLYISAGSACSSGTTQHSKILQTLDYSKEESMRGIRLSFGETITKYDLSQAFQIIDLVLNQ